MSKTKRSEYFVFDVDSTLYPAEKRYDAAAFKLYGRPFYEEGIDWYDVPDLEHRFGKGYRRIFEEALGPDSFEGRELYPGVREAVHAISESYRVLLFTHHHAPNSVRSPLRSWLRESLACDFTLYVHTSRVRKAPKIKKVGGIALVDDKPDTLGESVATGLYTMTKIHPWNVELVKSVPQIRGFEHWDEVVPILSRDGML